VVDCGILDFLEPLSTFRLLLLLDLPDLLADRQLILKELLLLGLSLLVTLCILVLVFASNLSNLPQRLLLVKDLCVEQQRFAFSLQSCFNLSLGVELSHLTGVRRHFRRQQAQNLELFSRCNGLFIQDFQTF
jgi:hypothetical protein